MTLASERQLCIFFFFSVWSFVFVFCRLMNAKEELARLRSQKRTNVNNSDVTEG